MPNNINCPLQEKEYISINKEGQQQTYTVGAKEWDLTQYIDTGSEEGIKQITHETLMVIRGEIINNVLYGIRWKEIFNNIDYLKSNNDNTVNAMKSLIQNDIYKVLANIDSIYEINDVSILPYSNDDKVINIQIVFTYIGSDLMPQIYTETIASPNF